MTTIATDVSASASEDTPDVMEPGSMAGPWRIEYQLGRGGMGTVYAVVHEDIGKRAALKLMHKKLSSRELDVERMLLEAKVVNQVQHPNIVDIFETGKLEDGRPYIVMERLDGVSLGQRAMKAKLLPDQVIAILRQICEAVTAAHEAGIIHRDLKVDNVFLIETEDPTRPKAKVLDWGIAKVIDDNIRHTVDGQLVGTPHYLAPEQARGATVTPKTDVYSIGVMAYELFLEQLPFEAETAAEIMTMHLRVAPPLPSELWPEIPASLEVLILAMLAKNPVARPSTTEVITALDGISVELLCRKVPVTRPITVRPPSHGEKALAETQLVHAMKKPGWRYIAGGVALAAAAAVAMFGHTSSQSAEAAVAGTHDSTVSAPDPAVPPAPLATGTGTHPVIPNADAEARASDARDEVAAATAKALVSATPIHASVTYQGSGVAPSPTRAPLTRPAPTKAPAVAPTQFRKAPAKASRRTIEADPDATIDSYGGR